MLSHVRYSATPSVIESGRPPHESVLARGMCRGAGLGPVEMDKD